MTGMFPGSQFKASLHMLSAEEGGRNKPVALVIGYAATHWYRPQFALEGSELHYDCFVELPIPESISWFELEPDKDADVVIKLFVDLPIEVGWNFRLYEGARLVGNGIIEEILA